MYEISYLSILSIFILTYGIECFEGNYLMYNRRKQTRMIDAGIYEQTSPAEKEMMSLEIAATKPLDGSHEAGLHEFRENTEIGNIVTGGQPSDQTYYHHVSKMGNREMRLKHVFS